MAGRNAGSQRSVALPLTMAALVAAVLAVVVGALSVAGRDSAPATTVAPTFPATATVPTTAPPVDRSALVADAAAAYLTAWGGSEWEVMKALVAGPPRDFASRHVVWQGELGVAGAVFVPGSPTVSGTTASVPFSADLTIRGLGEWAYEGSLTLVEEGSRWLVDWSPATIHPLFAEGLEWEVDRSVPERAPILDRQGRPLAATQDVVTVGIEPARVTDRAALTTAVSDLLGVTAEDVDARLDAPGVRPDSFLPLVELPEPLYAELAPSLRPVPGLVFRRGRSRPVATDELAGHLVGRTGEITAELLDRLGPGYRAGDVVGRSGLELALEGVLGGRPSGEIRLVDAEGKQVLSHEFTGVPPAPVQVTIDLEVQQAAEAALATVPAPAALVAVDVADGSVLAAVATPADAFNRALAGRYPPGSTFKIVTAAAALEAGKLPADELACPEEIEVDGRTFGNASSVPIRDMTFEEAFSESCNTAFIGLALDVAAEDITATSERFGFGAAYRLPVPAFGGSFPTIGGPVEQAAAAIGQARVEASPLHMASVAAAVAAGEWRPPHLVLGEPAEARPLDPPVAAALQAMMRAVVERGTGRALSDAGEVHGKTGSAQFDSARPDDTHAWFVGYRDDAAFAVLVEEGGSGGGVAGPVAASFLALLDAASSPTS